MAKQGMKRPEENHKKSQNAAEVVSEIQGAAKHGNIHANPIIAGTESPYLKVYHTKPFSAHKAEKSIPEAYPVIDNDVARDNIENDLTFADLQDL